MADVQTAMTEMMDFIDNDKQMKCTAECNTENNNNINKMYRTLNVFVISSTNFLSNNNNIIHIFA